MKYYLILIAVLFSVSNLFAQKQSDFEVIYQTKTTSVKDQGRSGTCWSYAAISFFESEILREKQIEINLSEMYPVYFAYISKAKYYLQLHTMANFAQGGQAHDVTNEVLKYGLVPENVYTGLIGKTKHNHSKMEKELKSYLDSINEIKIIPNDWLVGFENIMKKHIGEVPEKFEYQEKTYTPLNFSTDFLDINIDDYIELTSFSHQPYYKPFDLEVPDNWSHDNYYNLPIEEFMQVMEYALKNGYSICWDGDVSEKSFRQQKLAPELSENDLNMIETKKLQQTRQITFENRTTKDDHLMHITGLVKDKTGKKYFVTKNSWGEYNKFGGYIYIEENYIALKTIAIMIHKDAIPKEILNKMNL